MYRPPHLTPAQRDELLDTIRLSHDERPYAELRTLDGGLDRTLTGLTSLGQTQLDNTGRSRILTVSDPNRRLHDVQGFAIRKRILHTAIEYDCSFGTVRVPTFTGPGVLAERSGDVVTITARGKAGMRDHNVVPEILLPAGMKVTAAAIRLMVDRGGERAGLIDLTDHPLTLHQDVGLSREDTVWPGWESFMHTLNFITFYDPSGVLIGKPHPKAAALTMATGPGGWLLSSPSISHDARRIVNTVDVYWGHPMRTTRGEHRVTVTLPDANDLSPEGLKSNGVPCHYIATLHQPHVPTASQAEKNARRVLKQHQKAMVNVTATCKRFPLFEPGDILDIRDRHYRHTATLASWVLPDDITQPMALGWVDVRWLV